jgi:nucleotide-binding universal stress UspA family protein
MSPTSGFRSIMVPLDGSQLAEGAIQYALAIAERAQAKVRFVLVNPHSYPPLLIEPPTVYLREVTERFRERLGSCLSSLILNGPVAPSLAKHAREIGADLVVMTTHGWGGLRRAWLGSVTEELIRSTEIPVLVIRPGKDGSLPSLDLREILVPLDGSLLAEVALQPAAAMAKLWNAKISLLQVVHPTVLAGDPTAGSPVKHNDELIQIGEEANAYVRDEVDRLRLTGAAVSGGAIVATAGVAQTLLGVAKSERVSLIAMATHGRGGLPRLVLGSVTNKIVRTAEVPVLVVPHSRTARQIAKVLRPMIREASQT